MNDYINTLGSHEPSAAGVSLAPFPFEPRHDSYEKEEHGVMVFRPTLAEMADFSAYVRFMESVGAANEGIAKVNKMQRNTLALIPSLKPSKAAIFSPLSSSPRWLPLRATPLVEKGMTLKVHWEICGLLIPSNKSSTARKVSWRASGWSPLSSSLSSSL